MSSKNMEKRWKNKKDKEDFLSLCELDENELNRLDISWSDLKGIFEDHMSCLGELEEVALMVSRLLQSIPKIHSVRLRVKTPKSLVHKIVRKISENPDRDITLLNYKSEIGDLVGVRILYLLKTDFPVIHEYLDSGFNLLEPPRVYARVGDTEWQEKCCKLGCVVENRENRYCSVHYDIEMQITKKKVRAEIQVRSIYEEGWSEIDHNLNYPENSAPMVVKALDVLNQLAGLSDSLSMLVSELAAKLRMSEGNDKASKIAFGAVVSGLGLPDDQANLLMAEAESFIDQSRIDTTVFAGGLEVRQPSSSGLVSVSDSPMTATRSCEICDAYMSSYFGPVCSRHINPKKCISCGSWFEAGFDVPIFIFSNINMCKECQKGFRNNVDMYM